MMNTEAGKIRGNLHTWGILEVQNHKVPWGNYDIKDSDKPRGLSDTTLQETATFATNYDKKEGYLLTARGNPFGNVVKDGKKVIMHSATGNDFQVPLLKQLSLDETWKNSMAMIIAMDKVKKHAENYIDIPIQANPVLPYEHALKHESGALEMRLIIRPLSRMSIDYIDPHIFKIRCPGKIQCTLGGCLSV